MSNKNQFINSKALSVDEFFDRVLFDKKRGYYSSKIPFGSSGDFLTSPGISNVFSEIIGIWIISTWEIFGKPKNFNIVELGPGDGSLTKVLLKVFEKFSESLRARGKKNPFQKEIDDAAKGGVDADTAMLDRYRDQIDDLSLESTEKILDELKNEKQQEKKFELFKSYNSKKIFFECLDNLNDMK